MAAVWDLPVHTVILPKRLILTIHTVICFPILPKGLILTIHTVICFPILPIGLILIFNYKNTSVISFKMPEIGIMCLEIGISFV